MSASKAPPSENPSTTSSNSANTNACRSKASRNASTPTTPGTASERPLGPRVAARTGPARPRRPLVRQRKPPASLGGPGVRTSKTMVHLTESITNRTVVRSLADLGRVVKSLALEKASAPAGVGVRVGWATDQVVPVLGEAGTALSPSEVQALVVARSGREVKYSTVLRTLRDGRWAKTGKTVSVGPGRYRLG